MTSNVHVDSGQKPAKRFRGVLLVLISLALIFSIGFGYFIKSTHDTVQNARDQFEQSMEQETYAAALAAMRVVQTAVADAEESQQATPNEELVRETLAWMEQQIEERVDIIVSTVSRDNTPLTEDDRLFLESMEEITGMLISSELRLQSTGFLLGETSRARVTRLLETLGNLNNVSQPTKQLIQQLDVMETASPDVKKAENTLQQKQYFEALSRYETLSVTHDGFVQEFALDRAQVCRETMLQPLMEQARTLMDSQRNYSARDLLSRLRDVFPHEQRVEVLYQESLSLTEEKLDPYYGNVEHITVRPLITETERAFDGDTMQYSIAQSLVTTKEFSALLRGLYERDFILIDIDRLLDEEGKPATLSLPSGKKPLILTLETLNYYPHRSMNGTISQLVLDEDGHVSGKYLNASGTFEIHREAESVGIVDAFVSTHPDFSFDGAKGIISVTGYEDVFGYVLNESQLKRRNVSRTETGLPALSLSVDDFSDNVRMVESIADTLRRTGWKIASSTYGYIQPGHADTTIETLENDTRSWMDEVGAHVGGSDIYVYPNGSFLNGDDPRCLMLREYGFRFFSGIGPNSYSFFRDHYVYMDKVAINGYAIDHENLSRFFNAAEYRDEARP